MIHQQPHSSLTKIRFSMALKYNAMYLFVFLFLSCKMDNQKSGNTQILFEQTEFDFGEIPADENMSIVFSYTNIGENPLQIQNVITSCDCTISKWANKEIMPSKSGEIKIGIDPTYRGMFNAVVQIFYNGADSPKKLRIKGTVEYITLLD